MRKGLYSKWLFFIIAFIFTINIKAQHDKVTPEVVASFMEVVQKHSMSISDFLLNSNDYSTFIRALKNTNSLSILESEVEFIVFAPDNDAFSQFPSEVMKQLFMPENEHKLRSIVDYHIVYTNMNLERELLNLNGIVHLIAVNNEVLEICLESEDSMFIYDANGYPIAIKQKIELSNGIIYTIDAVILPQVDVKVALN